MQGRTDRNVLCTWGREDAAARRHPTVRLGGVGLGDELARDPVGRRGGPTEQTPG
jgi:hypothetical protein